jgi:hypothetical protein
MQSVAQFIAFEGAVSPVTVNLGHISSVAPYRGDKDQTLITLGTDDSTAIVVRHPYNEIVAILDNFVGVIVVCRQEATA